MKIGVFGGTFNPPHLGHKNILCQSIKKLKLNMVLVIPNNIPSHKNLPQHTATAKHRFEMCKVMCEDIENAFVSDIEIKMGGKSYTIRTLEKLKEKYKNDELYLIIGTDSFQNIETWARFEDILSICELLVFKRAENDNNLEHKKYIEQKYGVLVHLIENETIEISSSELRQYENIQYLSEKVLDYIEKNSLYKE